MIKSHVDGSGIAYLKKQWIQNIAKKHRYSHWYFKINENSKNFKDQTMEPKTKDLINLTFVCCLPRPMAKWTYYLAICNNKKIIISIWWSARQWCVTKFQETKLYLDYLN